jgi:GNAT superfamily N-acetyltransferase
VRIVDIDALDEDGWRSVLARHAEVFAARQMPMCVQLAEPLTGDALPGKWRVSGARYHHVATDIADFSGESNLQVRFVELATESDIHAFSDMMMVDRIPEPMHERARPSIRALMGRTLESPHVTMLLVYDGDDLVGQLALFEAKGERCDGYCVTTLSVARPFRGRGYMKALYAAIARSFQGQLYGQIIDGVPTLNYRQRFPSTRVLATVGTHQRVDDAYGDRWPTT